MDEAKQRVAIWEAAKPLNRFGVMKRGWWYRPKQCGYTGNESEAGRYTLEEAKRHESIHCEPDDVIVVEFSPPDYLNDLNAMAEAEKVLTHVQCIAYHECLNQIQATDTQERNGEIEYQAQDFWFHATAPQRAEAFLRTLNLWES